jgi:hypothetical protein
MSQTTTVPLGKIAHGRSGDKGSHANVAIIANNPKVYQFLKEYLTAEKVQAFFVGLSIVKAERFEAPGVCGLNFMLYEALAGGASQSLRSDTQGKTYALALMRLPIPVPNELLEG